MSLVCEVVTIKKKKNFFEKVRCRPGGVSNDFLPT